MTRDQFVAQTNRLKARWPGNTFGEEFLAILWRETQNFSIAWFTRVVDKFIGELRQPPLMPEFRTEIAYEREKNWGREKAQHGREAKEFFLIANDDEFRRSLMATILDRLHGRCPDATWEQFLHGLEKLTGRAS